MVIDEHNINAIVKGYFLQACKECNYTDDEISRALEGLRWAFDSLDIEKAYNLGK